MSSLPRSNPKPHTVINLPCGCIPGEFLCQEAESLWRTYNSKYHQELVGTATQAEVDSARRAYDRHYAAIGRVQP